MIEQFHVQIPATSANVGSGFDALGIALTLFNDIYFSVQPEYNNMKIVVEGLGKESIPTVFSENMVCQAMQIVADTVGKSLPGGTLTLVNRIPPARGLGSSSAAIVGGIVLADALLKAKLSKSDMLIIAAKMEGHPDNVAPALYGGLCASVMNETYTITNSLPIGNDLSFVVVSPDVEVSTHDARQVLPQVIDYSHAVFNVSRVSFLVTSILAKKYDHLALGLEDKLHVPYRIQLIPHGEAVLQAAMDAGAKGATISGSGSTLIAFVTDDGKRVLEAMVQSFEHNGLASKGYVLNCCNKGAVIL
ncbi:MAG: homoserine kinase [Megasphaera sp.]|jgi:homoserine kinase|uniref:homoserine kinase n=1 Tax=Megasphaera sueciensis TaxID=349094 RepID=UPI003D05B8E6|nr:homoserine kinase [Megasphaera sp.]MCI1822903.1 homoserine kinase [Megasphaera sp.]